MRKSFIAATALAGSLAATGALAAQYEMSTCSADGVTVNYNITVQNVAADKTGDDVARVLQTLLDNTNNPYTKAQIEDFNGTPGFRANVTQQSIAASKELGNSPYEIFMDDSHAKPVYEQNGCKPASTKAPSHSPVTGKPQISI